MSQLMETFLIYIFPLNLGCDKIGENCGNKKVSLVVVEKGHRIIEVQSVRIIIAKC